MATKSIVKKQRQKAQRNRYERRVKKNRKSRGV